MSQWTLEGTEVTAIQWVQLDQGLSTGLLRETFLFADPFS